MLRTLATIVSLGALAALAASQNYAQRNSSIRAGILLVDSQRNAGVPSNHTPHVWFNLDNNRSAKPAGWNIYNPRATTQANASTVARWTALDPGGAPVVGDAITKRHAAYWEVPLLAAGDQEITDYDILLLSARGFVSLNPTEREKLRRFCDNGGTLWVDVTSTATLDSGNSFPLPFGSQTANIGAVPGADFSHPLLSYPNLLSNNSINSMTVDAGSTGMTASTLTAGMQLIMGTVAADTLKLGAIAASDRGPIIAVGRVGDGFVVVTTRGVSSALNRVIVGSGYVANTGYTSGNATSDRSANAGAALVVNMLHLNSGISQVSGFSHKTNSTPVDLWAPLLKRFNAPHAFRAGTKLSVPVVAYKGLLITSTANQIVVYDANPATDLDRDGRPDDGLQDYETGLPYDRLWTSGPLGGDISAPVAVEIPEAGFAPKDQILVNGPNGLIAFDAFQYDINRRITATTNATPAYVTPAPATGPASYSNVDAPGPYAPTVHEGLAYVADMEDQGLGKVGRVWIVDLANGQKLNSALDWEVGGSSNQHGTIPEVAGSPTVGYIPVADNSGALDKVVYVPTRNVPGSLSPTGSAGFVSLWAGVRGENIKTTDWTTTAATLSTTTRASVQGLNVHLAPNSGVGLKLTVVDAAGNPWNEATMNAVFDGTVLQSAPGVLNFGLNVGGQAALSVPGIQIRIDYTIDWGIQVLGPISPIERGRVHLPDDTGKTRRILDNIALSPKGTLYVVHGDQSLGGSLYSFREEGRGQFKLLYRYELYDQHQINLNQAASVQYRETLIDTDPVTQFAPAFLAGPLRRLSFQAGPTVRNDTVYVTARGSKGGFGVPMTVVMAFRAEPDTVQIRVGDLPGNFSIVQPDMARSGSKTIPETFSTLQAGQFTYEKDPGQDSGTIRIDNMSSATRGALVHTISTSQPIIIRRSGQPDRILEPGLTSTRFSPLLWFTVMHGVENQSPVLVTGETAFVVGQSALPSILDTGTIFPFRGVAMGMDATISSTDGFLVSDTLRPWQKQLHQIKIPSPGNIQGNPDMRWPQANGVRTFDDWRVRLLQTAMGPGMALGISGGEGALYIWQQNEIWSFSRADFIVADEGRISRFDPSGNPIWSSDASVNTGPIDVTASGNVKPLVRPTRAYRLNATQMIVVDTGGDRIVLMDNAGRETRSITGFKLDPASTPAGFEPSETMQLREPRDVVVFGTYEQNPANVTNPSALELWNHHLIADSGNKRLIELVDRYEVDPVTRRIIRPIDLGGNNGAALGVLYWHTGPELSGKNFVYTSVARVWNPLSSRFVYAAGIGGRMPTRVDIGLDAPAAGLPRESGTGNGGIVLFDGANSTVINEIQIPATGVDVLWSETTSSFNSAARAARPKSVGNVTSVTMRMWDVGLGGGPKLSVMFTDEAGVYEVVAAGSTWQVQWMMPNEAYRVLRRFGAPSGQPWLGAPTGDNAQLRAMYARRLDSGEVLLVNGFQGLNRNRVAYSGEVIQVNGDVDVPTSMNNALSSFSFFKVNFGFRSTSVAFELPPVQGTRGIVIPVFADRN